MAETLTLCCQGDADCFEIGDLITTDNKKYIVTRKESTKLHIKPVTGYRRIYWYLRNKLR